MAPQEGDNDSKIPVIPEENSMKDIVITLITSTATILTVLIQSKLDNKKRSMHAAKQSILQMILEDHILVNEGHLPENHQAILHEFDIYTKNGGNSYVADKVKKYRE